MPLATLKKVVFIANEYQKLLENIEKMKIIMKIKVLIVLTLSLFINQIQAQDSIGIVDLKKKYFSLYIQSGVAMQKHSYPTEKDHGITGEGFLPIFGLGINYTYPITSWFSIRPQLNYIQKGCSYRGKISGEKVKYNNRFHYVTADILLIFKINKWNIKPYFQTGLRNELLVAYNIEYDIDRFSGNYIDFIHEPSYPDNSNYKDFNRYNYSIINGIGVEFKKGWYLEFDTNLDLGYVVKNDNMKVWNVVTNIAIGIKL